MADPFLENLPEHIACLGTMFDHPRRAYQRLVEQMTFLPDGGRHWVRTLQIQLPAPDSSSSESGWHAISLGVFRRRRLPDLVAHDATGARLNLLTRNQHGSLLVGYVLSKHFGDFPDQAADLEKASGTHHRQLYDKLVALLYDTVTTVGDIDHEKRPLRKPSAIYEYLLRSFDPLPANISLRVAAFRSNFEDLLNFTHYLCWVQGQPGDVINVQTIHTTADIGQRPEWNEKDFNGSQEPSTSGVERRAGWFRTFGLAPLKCECSTPSNGFASSYYLTLEPPAKTEITFLDWATGNTFEDDKKEQDSALDSVHFHYRHDSLPAPSEHGRAVRAYMRCSTHGHKQIAAGAALNFVFVILVASGGFSDTVGGSAQTWLLVTPTILTAYIADQQRHYYSYPTRRQRAILWVYLTFSVGFLVATSFRFANSTNGDHWTWWETWTAWVLLVSSAAVCTWYALLGYSFRWITKTWTTRLLRGTKDRRERLDEILDEVEAPAKIRPKGREMLPSPRRTYENVVYSYCKIVFGLVIVASLATIIGIKLLWDTSPKHKSVQRQTGLQVVRQGALTMMTWPSNECKDCVIRLRSVPTGKEDPAVQAKLTTVSLAQ